MQEPADSAASLPEKNKDEISRQGWEFYNALTDAAEAWTKDAGATNGALLVGLGLFIAHAATKIRNEAGVSMEAGFKVLDAQARSCVHVFLNQAPASKEPH